MYYYIMEPASKKNSVWQEKVKSILGDLGIAGETVTPSPARTIEELASLGVIKGYSTIVAVGSEKIANKVASAIINQKENNEVVLGVIPENYDGLMAKKICVKDLKDACETLKFRKLQTIDACLIEPHQFCLTQAEINSPDPIDAYLATSSIQAGFTFNRIVISPGVKMEIEDNSEQEQKKSIFRWFHRKKENDIVYNSLFCSKKITLETPRNNIPVLIDGEIVAKTPAVFQNRVKVLKIIVARDIINAKE